MIEWMIRYARRTNERVKEDVPSVVRNGHTTGNEQGQKNAVRVWTLQHGKRTHATMGSLEMPWWTTCAAAATYLRRKS